MAFDFNAPYSRDSFLEFLANFLPDDFEKQNMDMEHNRGKITKITQLGECPSLKDLRVFEVEHDSKDARVTLSREIFKFMRSSSIEYSLVAFVPKDKSGIYRFSFIKNKARYENDKMNFDRSNPKRFSYPLGAGQHVRTPRFRLQGAVRGIGGEGIDDLASRFSIEVLTDEFYKELSKWYERALGQVIYPDKTKKEEHVIRLITRLMFVWFIKQKKLVPDNFFDPLKVNGLLKNFDQDSPDNGVYYNAILQNLFFATLNKEIKERAFAAEGGGKYRNINPQYNVKNLFRDNIGATFFTVSHEDVLREFVKVPFLNGGLFECLIPSKEHSTDDGFSREPKKRAFVPNNLFFANYGKNDEEGYDSEDGIITILNRYNWTIEENTPDDVEVALDPELLGKVFEKLLGEIDETARKETGSFYTPRQVVQFMVDESIAEYLGIKIERGKKLARKIMTSIEIPKEADKNYLESIKNALKGIKILDPACGSGAFPMGILNRVVEIFNKIDPDMTTEERYNLKIQLIEDCIYGVDVQSIAIQITKLRFFIALISEQEKPDDAKDNYGIRSLPNLETKFVAANALVKLKERIIGALESKDEELEKLKDELSEIRSHKMIRARKYADKVKLRERDRELCKQMKERIASNLDKPNKEAIAFYNNEIRGLEKEREKYAGAKWIERTVPTLFEEGPPEKVKVDANAEKRRKIDDEIKENRKLISDEENKAANDEDSKEIEKITGWNPYIPTGSAEFFDPAWMFPNTEKFDIVIGNPPYLQLQKGNALKKVYAEQGYESYTSMGDIYQLFYERGLELLSDSGHLCFITSNKWLRGGYGEKSRRLFSENFNTKLLADLGPGVFKGATVDTCILLLQKAQQKQNETTLAWKNKEGDNGIENMSDYIQQERLPMKFTGDSWVILDKMEQSIKAKIEKVGIPLKDWDINIYRGILTGCNEAFIIDGKKREELIAKDPKSAEIIRPILRGRDIKRYSYEFADLYLIAAHNGYKNQPRIDINSYPAVKEWLENGGIAYDGKIYHGYKTIEKRADQGDTPYNLRCCVYMEDFFKPKIVWSDIAMEPTFVYIKEPMFLSNTCYMMTNPPMGILGILNSKIIKWYFPKIATDIGIKGSRYFKQFVEILPMPKHKDNVTLYNKIELIISNPNNNDFYINDILYNFYELSNEEIKLLEGLIYQ
jgi:hypothetical protein